jgi:hypothetical protein
MDVPEFSIRYRCVKNWLFSGLTVRRADEFSDETIMGSYGLSVELKAVQHVVSILALTHKRRFGILGCVKSNFLSFF